MKKHKTTHEENLDRMARIEGQVRGIRRMIEEGAYCVDIITQIQAVRAALRRVGHRILRKHMEHCLADAALKHSRRDLNVKMAEIMKLFRRREL